MVGGDSGDKLTFELNLVPFIDVLSTSISFLLMTAAMIQLGGFGLSQATGSQIDASLPPPSVAVEINSAGDVSLLLKDIPGQASIPKDQVRGLNGKVDAIALGNKVALIKQRFNMVATVFIMPSTQVKYDEVIKTMQVFRDKKISQVGLVPLKNNI